MNPLEATWIIFGVSVHAYTVILLGLTLVGAIIILGANPRGLVGASAAVALVVHFYELLHGSFEWGFAGFLTPSVYTFNIPAAALSLAALVWLRVFIPRSVVVDFLALLLVSFAVMGFTGFYSGYPKTPVWALSKALASITVLSILRRPEP